MQTRHHNMNTYDQHITLYLILCDNNNPINNVILMLIIIMFDELRVAMVIIVIK